MSRPAVTTGARARSPRPAWLGLPSLQPPEDRVRPLAVAVAFAQLGDRRLGVVLDPAQLELAAVGVDQRVGGARVAVERDADRARVHELEVADRGRAAEL